MQPGQSAEKVEIHRYFGWLPKALLHSAVTRQRENLVDDFSWSVVVFPLFHPPCIDGTGLVLKMASTGRREKKLRVPSILG